MPLKPHQKIINKLARKHLRPMGLIQKGQSRTWLDDHGTFTTIVEFQPYSGRQGTFLNIGINFHWNEQDYFSFDTGGRCSEFVGYENDDQFEEDLQQLIKIIESEVATYRVLKDSERLYRFIINHEFNHNDSLWTFFHRGNAYALRGERNNAIDEFKKILNTAHNNIDWIKVLQEQVKVEILDALEMDFKE